MSNLVFCLMGPTACGKTDIALQLVELFPFEIVSVDAALIYREMNIGTAKPDKTILEQIPHHLIDIINPTQSYSVKDFCDASDRLCDSIYKKGKIPLFVGGTMMYFNALQKGLADLPSANIELRTKLIRDIETHGLEFLHNKLKNLDPVAAQKIHVNDKQRIQRALEVAMLSDESLNVLHKKKTKPSAYKFINIILLPENRPWLHKRIEQRFNMMLKIGFIEEVQLLIEKWSLTNEHISMRTIGYRQVYSFLQNEYDYETLVHKGIVATRQLAKRQLTWLRSWSDANIFCIDKDNVFVDIMALIQEILDNEPEKLEE